MLTAVCPNNKDHKKFTVTPHVTQDWEVDENGNYLHTLKECVEVTHSPDEDDVWVCSICGAEAIVSNE